MTLAPARYEQQYKSAQRAARLIVVKSEQKWGPLEYTAAPIPSTRGDEFFNVVAYKAATFLSNKNEAESFYEVKRARAVWDPKLSRYRCPPGTRFGGRITNRIGAGCGGGIVRRLIGQGIGGVNVGGKPNAPGGQRGGTATRPVRATAGRAAQAGSLAYDAGRGNPRVDTQPGDVRVPGLSANEVQFAASLNAFGRLLAKFAENVDIDDEEIEDIADRTGLNKETLTPERREKLGKMGEAINRALNRFAAQIDVEDIDPEGQEVENLRPRTDGAPAPQREGRGRLARLADRIDVPDRSAGGRDVENLKPRTADGGRNAQERRNERERVGIARRERQIARARRLEEAAARLNPDDPDNLPGTLGGRIRNPQRRQAQGIVNRAMAKWNARRQERLLEAARGEYQNLDRWWAERLGRDDFNFNDIRRFVNRLEKRNDVGDDAMDLLRRNRDDWGELRPFFDPFDSEEFDNDEVLDAFNRLGNERWYAIMQAGDVDRTLNDLNEINEMREKDIAAMKKAVLAEGEIFEGWKKDLGRGELNPAKRDAWKAKKRELIRQVTQKAIESEGIRLKRERGELPDPDQEPLERAKIEARATLLNQEVASKQNIIDLMNRQEDLFPEAFKPAQVIVPPPDNAVLAGRDNVARGAKIARNIKAAGDWQLYDDPPPLPERLGQIGEINEAGMPAPKRIINDDIKTAEAAITFVKNGGNLGEVPNDFWFKAVNANSSEADDDTSTVFKKINPGRGALGETTLFAVRDDKGRATYRGWVFKAANPERNISEKVSFGLMAAAGLPVPVAGEDGVSEGEGARRRQPGFRYIVQPLAGNLAPDGKLEFGEKNFEPHLVEDTPDKAMPGRLFNLMHNYLLGVGDRHGNNGMLFMVDGKPFVMPIDQGETFEAVRNNLPDYLLEGFDMDWGLLDNIRNHIGSITDNDEAVKQARAIVDTYDGYVANIKRILETDKNTFVAHMVNDVDVQPDQRNRYVTHAERLYDLIEKQTRNLETQRNELVGMLVPDRVAALMEGIDETRQTVQVALPEVNRNDNPLIPTIELRPRSEYADLDKAVEYLKEGGNLAEIPDLVLFDAMFRVGNLRSGNIAIHPEEMADLAGKMTWEKGDTFSNDRFDFKVLKGGENMYYLDGPWVALEVEDKTNGRKYFLKANNYGVVGDAVGEALGADVARMVGFDNDEREGAARIGPLNELIGAAVPLRPWRWVMVPHVADYNKNEKDKRKWQTMWERAKGEKKAVNQGGNPVIKDMRLHNEDVARLLVMDYLLNNQDRHIENIMVTGDGRNLRVAPIDHALIGFNRRGNQSLEDGRRWNGQEGGIEELAERFADKDPAWYKHNMFNNPYTGLFGPDLRLADLARKEEIAKRIEAIIKGIQNVDQNELFNPDRMGRRGVKWTATELQHIEAIKKIFSARLTRLRKDPGILMAPLK